MTGTSNWPSWYFADVGFLRRLRAVSVYGVSGFVSSVRVRVTVVHWLSSGPSRVVACKE